MRAASEPHSGPPDLSGLLRTRIARDRLASRGRETVHRFARHRGLEPSCYSDPLKYAESHPRTRFHGGQPILDSRLAPSIATNSVFDRLRRRTTRGFHRPIQTK
jgi:hypothetical protein